MCLACVGALYVLKNADAAVPAGLLVGDEYSVTSYTKPMSGRERERGGLKQNPRSGGTYTDNRAFLSLV